MKDRIRQVREALSLSRQEFAQKLGISVSSIESYEYGRRVPSGAQIELLCRKLGVNEGWMLTGEGEMFVQFTIEKTISRLFDDVAHDPADATRKKIFLGLAILSPEDWETVERILNKMMGKKEEPGQ